MKKLKGNISVTVTIFLLALIIFCICAIDVGYVVTARYKTQKITETLALYMASSINSSSYDETDDEAELENNKVNDIKKRFEDLYSNYDLSGFYGFKVSKVIIKKEEDNTKVKIITETYLPTIFLRYAGIGIIKVMQTSHALAGEVKIPLDTLKSTDLYYTFKAKDIITDKNGDDIRVNYDDGDYFIFVGLEDFSGNIHWAEIGSMTKADKVEYKISNVTESHGAYCVENTSGYNTFNLSANSDKKIGLVKYIKIFKADCTSESLPSETSGIADEPEVWALNSARLIRKSAF